MHIKLCFLLMCILWIFATNTQIHTYKHKTKKSFLNNTSQITHSEYSSHSYYKFIGIICCGISLYCACKSFDHYNQLQKSFEIKNIAYALADWCKSYFVDASEEEAKYSIQESFLYMLCLSALSITFGTFGIQLLSKSYTTEQGNRCTFNRKNRKFCI